MRKLIDYVIVKKCIICNKELNISHNYIKDIIMCEGCRYRIQNLLYPNLSAIKINEDECERYENHHTSSKRGEWIGEADGYWNGELIYDIWHCSFCDYQIEEDNQELLPNYCPNCGAKMKGYIENE